MSKIIIILLIAELVIILFQTLQILNLSEVKATNVIGTYCTKNASENIYIVFEHSGGICAIYKQFGDVEKGSYQQEENVIMMIFCDKTTYAIYEREQLYIFDPDGTTLYILQKISNTPTYINVKH